MVGRRNPSINNLLPVEQPRHKTALVGVTADLPHCGTRAGTAKHCRCMWTLGRPVAGPNPPQIIKESNWLATRAEGRFFASARSYGPTQARPARAWELGDSKR